MKIRKLETEEKQNTKKLYEEVFSEDSKSFVDYYYEEKLKDNQIYVVEERQRQQRWQQNPSVLKSVHLR